MSSRNDQIKTGKKEEKKTATLVKITRSSLFFLTNHVLAYLRQKAIETLLIEIKKEKTKKQRVIDQTFKIVENKNVAQTLDLKLSNITLEIIRHSLSNGAALPVKGTPFLF